MDFNENLKKLRRERGLTQKKLAALAGVSLRAIQNYEQGNRTPRAETVKRLCEILEVEPETLVGSLGKYLAQKNMSEVSLLKSLVDHPEEFGESFFRFLYELLKDLDSALDDPDPQYRKRAMDLIKNTGSDFDLRGRLVDPAKMITVKSKPVNLSERFRFLAESLFENANAYAATASIGYGDSYRKGNLNVDLKELTAIMDDLEQAISKLRIFSDSLHSKTVVYIEDTNDG